MHCQLGLRNLRTPESNRLVTALAPEARSRCIPHAHADEWSRPDTSRMRQTGPVGPGSPKFGWVNRLVRRSDAEGVASFEKQSPNSSWRFVNVLPRMTLTDGCVSRARLASR